MSYAAEPIPPAGLAEGLQQLEQERKLAMQTSGALPEKLTIAVAGQPNTGKSTIFNKLTGMRQRVGNWPGKTVERKEGSIILGGRTFTFVDLPGSYALTAASLEEEVAREYLLSGEPDLVLAVINAAALESGLFFVAELLLLGLPLVVALNMVDVAEAEGRSVDAHVLADRLGVPVVPLVGTKADGIIPLKEVLTALGCEDLRPQPALVRLPPPTQAEERLALLTAKAALPFPDRWAACKLLERDAAVTGLLERRLPAGLWKSMREVLAAFPDGARQIYTRRFAWIHETTKAAVQRGSRRKSRTDAWDNVLLHPFWGRCIAYLVIPLGLVLGVILGMLSGGMVLQLAMESAPAIKAAWPGMIGSLLGSAIVPALGWITALLAIIAAVYAVFHFLEDTGYLARVSYLMDARLGRLGVDGKSAIPLLMGMLCNTVAIAGSRIVNSRRQRLIVLSMLPFLPCSGQTAVALMFAFALFPLHQALSVVVCVTLVNILLAGISGRIINRFLPSPEASGLVMELPLYHKPNFKTILEGVRTRVLVFLRGAAGNILCCLILVWAVSYFPDGDITTSYLYRFGRWLEPVGVYFGFDWRFIVAIVSSFFAKETTAGTLAVLFSVTTPDKEAILTAIRGAITPQGALAFIVLSNLYIPCLATISVLRNELGGWKITGLLLAVMFLVALLAAAATYAVASAVL